MITINNTGNCKQIIKLSDIVEGAGLNSKKGYEGVIISSPIEIEAGKSSDDLVSFFQVLFGMNGRLMCETFQGKSNKQSDMWKYDWAWLTEVDRSDEEYTKWRDFYIKWQSQ